MTRSTASVRTRGNGAGPSGPAAPSAPRRTGRRWSTAATAIGWTVAMIATIGIFVGGAGGLMLLAGHVAPATLALATTGAVSLTYLVWFLSIGPGHVPETATAASRRDAPGARSGGRYRPAPRLAPSTCSFCGRTQTPTNRVKTSGRVAICERCIAAAVGELSEYWAMRTEFRRASDRS